MKLTLQDNLVPFPDVTKRHREARAACEAVKIMLARDFALAQDSGVTIIHGNSGSQKVILDFNKLHFSHEDLI